MAFLKADTVARLDCHGCGDQVAFFLLRPNNMSRSTFKDDELNYRYKLHRVGPASNLIYSNCYFNPLALPIMGTYNDYGGVEDIEENSNTKAIEKFFGIKIQALVDAAQNTSQDVIDLAKLSQTTKAEKCTVNCTKPKKK